MRERLLARGEACWISHLVGTALTGAPILRAAGSTDLTGRVIERALRLCVLPYATGSTAAPSTRRMSVLR
jgi:hypothetical protein